MTEPTSGAYIVTGAVTALLGPVIGPFALLLFGAACGSLLAMSKVPMASRWAGVRYVAIGVGLSMALTGIAVWVCEALFNLPASVALMPLSLLIAAGREQLMGLVQRIYGAIAAGFEAFASRKGAGE